MPFRSCDYKPVKSILFQKVSTRVWYVKPHILFYLKSNCNGSATLTARAFDFLEVVHLWKFREWKNLLVFGFSINSSALIFAEWAEEGYCIACSLMISNGDCSRLGFASVVACQFSAPPQKCYRQKDSEKYYPWLFSERTDQGLWCPTDSEECKGIFNWWEIQFCTFLNK